MERHCEFCDVPFDAVRKDKRFCSTKCRSQNHVVEKAAAISSGISLNHSERMQRNVNKGTSKIEMSSGQFDKLLNGQKQNNHMLTSILDEKEKAGDLKAEISKYEMKLFYLEDKLKTKEEVIFDLKDDLSKLRVDLSMNEKSQWDKLVEGVMSKPETLPETIASCQMILSTLMGKQDGAIGMNPISGLKNETQELKRKVDGEDTYITNNEEEVLVYANELSYFFKIPPNELLSALVEYVNENPTITKSLFSRILKNED